MSRFAEPSTVSGILLAAGASTRMAGEVPKQLVKIDSEPMIRRAARTALASRLSEVVVVLGYAAPSVAEALVGLDVRTVQNPEFLLGQSTSVRAGLAAIRQRSSAALFLPADQPLLSSDLIDRLIAAFEETGQPIVVPAHQGRRGAPVLFGCSLFSELKRLEGDTGGRVLLPRHEQEIAEVAISDPLELADVDTEEDLLGFQRAFK